MQKLLVSVFTAIFLTSLAVETTAQTRTNSDPKRTTDEVPKRSIPDGTKPAIPVAPKRVNVTPLKTIPLSLNEPSTFVMPFKAEDLNAGERIYRGKFIHTEDPDHEQHWGYDLSARRWDSANNSWTSFTTSTASYNANPTNDKSVIYGKNVYAVADGTVTRCWRNAPENPRPRISGDPSPEGTPEQDKPWLSQEFKDRLMHFGGNFVQYELDDGTVVRQSHFIPGSVPSAICPHNNALYTTASANSQTDVTNGARISAGQYLGRVGNVGNSTGPHLHIHRHESGTPKMLRFKRGLASPFTGTAADLNNWTSFKGDQIPPGQTLVWPPRSIFGEYTRFGFSESAMGRMFDHLADSGYWPKHIDGYSVGGKVYYNMVWEKAPGPWRAYFGQTQAKLQERLDKAKADGYAPVFIDSYTRNGQVRYAMVFRKGISGAWRVRSNRTTSAYDDILDQAKADGLKPVNVSVVSIGGERRYTALFRSNSIGSWQLKSQIKESDYQSVFNSNKAAGRHPIYLNGYMHNGTPYISAIFASKDLGDLKARHKMSGSSLQSEFNAATSAGFQTQVITAFDGAKSTHRYAALWRKK